MTKYLNIWVFNTYFYQIAITFEDKIILFCKGLQHWCFDEIFYIRYYAFTRYGTSIGNARLSIDFKYWHILVWFLQYSQNGDYFWKNVKFHQSFHFFVGCMTTSKAKVILLWANQATKKLRSSIKLRNCAESGGKLRLYN